MSSIVEPVVRTDAGAEFADEAQLPGRLRGAMHGVLSVPLYRNGYALVVNTGATTIIGTGFWVLAARHYSPHNVGVGAAAVNAMLFISGAAQLNLLAFLTRFLPVAGAQTRRIILLSYTVASVASVVLASAFLLVDSVVADPPVPVGWSWALYFIAATACWTIFTLQDGVMVGLRDARWVPVENVVFGIVKLVLVVALAGATASAGIFISWTASTVLGIIPVSWLIFRHLIVKRVQEQERERIVPPPGLERRALLTFAAADWVGSLFLLGVTTLLPVLVSRWFSPAETAFFAIAWLVGNSIDLLAQNLGASLTVEGAIAPDNLGRLARQSLRHLMGLLSLVATVVAVAAPLVLSVFGPGYAAHATTLLRLLAIAAIPRGINALLVSLSRVKHDMRRIVGMQAVNCTVAVVGGYLLSRTLGLAGVGVALLIGQSCVLVWNLPFLLRVLHQDRGQFPAWSSSAMGEPPRAVIEPNQPTRRRRMESRVIERPVIFIGMPRSGTSLISEAFSAHEDLGGLTTYAHGTASQFAASVVFRCVTSRTVPPPSRMVRTRTSATARRYLPKVSEVYYFWDRYTGVDFGRSYLLDATADAEVADRVRAKLARLLRWQGKSRLVVKTTGPGRIEFLSSIFPDAIFVHIVRDRASVVESLLRVSFWREGGGLREPFWRGGLTRADLERWWESGKDPGVLAAVQWDRVVATTRASVRLLPAGRVVDLSYEQFVARPREELHRMLVATDLGGSARAENYLDQIGPLHNLNVPPGEDRDRLIVLPPSEHDAPERIIRLADEEALDRHDVNHD